MRVPSPVAARRIAALSAGISMVTKPAAPSGPCGPPVRLVANAKAIASNDATAMNVTIGRTGVLLSPTGPRIGRPPASRAASSRSAFLEQDERVIPDAFESERLVGPGRARIARKEHGPRRP